MNLRDLHYFIAVAETRHFGRAADRCFVSQPTLSGQIKKLEDELGVTLFERTNRSVALTPIGETLLSFARRSVEEADALVQTARAHRDPLALPLRLGAIPTLSPYLMPLILAPLKEKHPQLRLVLSEEVTEQLVRRLRDHEIDVALLASPVDEPEFESTPLFDEPFWVAHPVDHPLYDQDDITPQALDGIDILLLADGHCLADQVMDVCSLSQRDEAGHMSDLRASSLETLLQLVSAGFGCTLVPALAVRGSWMTDTGVVARPLRSSDGYRTVSLVWRRTFPRARALEVLSNVISSHLPNTVRLREANVTDDRRAGR
ncbi:MAG: LysR substrate-binding domain-containing protein [Gammaproteobacteria bacterium]